MEQFKRLEVKDLKQVHGGATAVEYGLSDLLATKFGPVLGGLILKVAVSITNVTSDDVDNKIFGFLLRIAS